MSTSADSDPATAPHQGAHVVLDGTSVDPAPIGNWRTHVLLATNPVLSPPDAVRVQSIDASRHLLHVGGWMGALRVTTPEGAWTVRITDPKLDDATWSRLLNDLSQAVAALPLAELVDGAGVERTNDHPTPFVQRLVLRAYASQVIRALDAIAHRPHETLEVTDVWTTPDRATVATPGAVAAVMQRGAFVTTGPVAERLGGFAPAVWRDVRKQTNSDTPENRFARHASEAVLEVSRRFPDDDVLTDLASHARFALTRPPIRDAGPYRRFPASSRVLRERHGYRELRDAYFALRGSGRVRWDGLESAIRGGLRNTEVLYQYWCFLALQRHLGVERPELPTRRTPSAIHIELAEGVPSGVDTPRGFLWHERSFGPPRGTYAIPLRPDFSLAREDGGWDLFDAKFRLDDADEAKHDDLAKMHAYRDAIRGCHAAWVLYPGTKPETHPATPNEPPEDPSGIGVIPMRP